LYLDSFEIFTLFTILETADEVMAKLFIQIKLLTINFSVHEQKYSLKDEHVSDKPVAKKDYKNISLIGSVAAYFED
jgi:hypothetical protein